MSHQCSRHKRICWRSRSQGDNEFKRGTAAQTAICPAHTFQGHGADLILNQINAHHIGLVRSLVTRVPRKAHENCVLGKFHKMINHRRSEDHTPSRHSQPIRVASAACWAMVVINASLDHIAEVPIGLVVMIGPDGTLVSFDQYCALHRYVHQWLNAAARINKWRSQHYIRHRGPSLTPRSCVRFRLRLCHNEVIRVVLSTN